MIRKNILWNLFGYGLPLIIALYAVPKLLQGYGAEKFGMLSIIWGIIGYFSIFDLGMGRALTTSISERLHTSKKEEIPSILKSSLVLLLILGLLAFIFAYFGAAPLINNVLQVSSGARADTIHALEIMAGAIPFVIVSTSLIGILEGYSEFKSINIVRLFLGASNFLLPAIVIEFSDSLALATLFLLLSRIVATWFFYRATKKAVGKTFGTGRYQTSIVINLLKFGGWITVSNVVGPIMVQLDRLLIGTIIALDRLPAYVISSELLTRLSFVSAAYTGVFYPEFCRFRNDDLILRKVYTRGFYILFSFLIVFSVVFIIGAQTMITLWIGDQYGNETSAIAAMMVIGFFANGIARFPSALIQSLGRPDITAKLHVCELPIYLLLFFYLVNTIGIFGAGVAWTVRMVIDSLALSYLLGKLRPTLRGVCNKFIAITVLGVLILFSLYYIGFYM